MEWFERNLTALAQWQPDLAGRLKALEVPASVQSVSGRDGSQTFRLHTRSGGPPTWFGRSSMPSISSGELLAGFQGGGQNVCLPGVLTGSEPLIVAGRIPAFCATFVVEKELLHIKLALHLYDYHQCISLGRIMFFLTECLEEMLLQFFHEHCGYTMPTRLLPIPQCSAAELSELQHRLESVAQSTFEIQQNSMGAIRTRLSKRHPTELPNRPRLAIISNDAKPETTEEARRLQRAACQLGWPVEVCILDAPGSCHAAGRLSTIEHSDCELVVFVDCVDEYVSTLLPESIPRASWLLGPLPNGPLPSGRDSKRLYCAPTCSVKKTLLDQGVDERQIALCGPGADTGEWTHFEAKNLDGESPACDVAILIDLPDDRAASHGVTLTSHVQLWRSIQCELAEAIESYDPNQAVSILERAEKTSGVTLKDQAGRERFVQFVRDVIAPATYDRMTAHAVADQGFNLSIWGKHWLANSDSPTLVRAYQGALRYECTYQSAIRAARFVVLGTVNPIVVRTALDTLAAERFPICRGDKQHLIAEYPMLADMAPYIGFYRNKRELVEILSARNVSLDLGQNRNRAARKTVLAHHSLDVLLLKLVERLQGLYVADPQRDHC